ncbi:MAG: peptidylprolyl isomerase [Alphaproteobacteria bacterium]|nr:peptidylprolyl isomerase [Alphaproteobacteria bacterium]
MPPKPAKRPAVSVNGVIITDQEIRAETQQHPAKNPAEAYQMAARALAVRQLLLQEAARLNIVPQPKTVGAGKTETKEDAAIRALIEAEVQTPVADEKTCRQYYAANPDRFKSDTIYEASHILFAASPKDRTKRKKARADAELTLKVLSDDPARFAALARANSDCPSAKEGGNLGQLTKGATVPEFETVLFAMKAGQISPGPVPTPFGFHVIWLERIIAGRQLPFSTQKARIAGWLEAASWSRAVSQYITILAGRAEIVGVDFDIAEGPLVQ